MVLLPQKQDKVTNSDTSNEALNRSLGRIEGKQDLILTRLDGQAKEQEAIRGTVANLSRRVDGVETKMAYWAGGLAVMGTAAVFLKDRLLGVFF